MSEGIDDPDLEAQGELSLAALALDSGELEHAASHVANAFACAPAEPVMREALELVGRLHILGVRAMDAFPPAEREFLGAVVARAHLLAAEGRAAEAVPLMFKVAAHTPAAPWGVAGWLTADLGPALDPQMVAQLTMALTSAVNEPAPDALRATLAPFTALVKAAAAAHPDNGVLQGAASSLVRRCGDPADAVRLARAGVAAEPGLMTEMWLAYALRTAGDTEQALAAMYRASAHDPSYLPMHADIASMLRGMDRLDEAIAHAEAASKIDPAYDCIVYTLGDLRFERDGDLDHLVALADFARTQPRSGGCQHDELQRNCAGRPWLGFVPDASEAITNLLSQLLGSGRDDWRNGTVSLTLSALEVPSAMSTVRRAIPNLDVSIAAIDPPDIREPAQPAGRSLWEYRGELARPAVPPPAPEVARAVAAIAGPRLNDPVQAYDRALPLAGQPIEQLIRCLVYPPMPSATAIGGKVTTYPAWWARSNQVFACLGILHQHADEPWPDSRRRAALVELLWGQEDWTTEAAAYALVVAAWIDPVVRDDVVDLIGYRFLHAMEVSRSRAVTIRDSLARLALATPGMNPDVRGLANDVLAASERDDGTDPDEDGKPDRSVAAAEAAPRTRKRRWFGR